MRHAIQYALTYPARQAAELPPLNLATCGNLEFHEPDPDRFPCITLAYEALQVGGTMPAVLNAANEIAVAAFLKEQIKFGQIPELIRAACEAHEAQPVNDLETVLHADEWARQWVSRKISQFTVQSC